MKLVKTIKIEFYEHDVVKKDKKEDVYGGKSKSDTN